MKSHELAFARVEPRAIRRHDVASKSAYQYAARPSRSGPHPRSASVLGNPAGPAAIPPGVMAIFDLPVPSEARLRALFDLTAAEVRLAQRLARGDSVEEAAQALSIKMTTARTQLAAVFAKTNTRRQAKLVAILSRVAHLR
jgi:DNA-binding CsgD family transcriptional regulator